MNSTAKVRFALIGAGVIGDVHARALTELPTSRTLSRSSISIESKASIVARKYGVAEATDRPRATCCDAATSMR